LYAVICWGSWGIGQWAGRTHRRTAALEAERQVTEEAVTDERRRIAAELHDIVSHSVSVMVLQAAGARRIIGQDPDRAADALVHIEDVGKQSMEELRRLLGVLRDGQFLEGEAYSGLQPGLGDLDAYLETVRLSGLEVRLVVEGDPVRLDPSVDMSAYRIVREALTNSAKYAGPGSRAEVRLTWRHGELVIDVSDNGHAPAEDALGTGHGLVGLFERARAVGGRLEAGPANSGGFLVHATLPVPERSASPAVPTGQTREETGSS
jgi:signal transduction histidine kinase